MLLKNIASQLVQLGSLIKTADGSRLTSSATVRWCKDGAVDLAPATGGAAVRLLFGI